MKTDQAIKLAGTSAELARLLGVSRAAISQWPETVPPLRVYQLKELRPEWFAKPAAEQQQATT
jgi:hypothetical protein